MLLNNRHGSVDSDAYRYGFNGKEKDDEVKGEGNHYDYGMRIYDPRIAKFVTVDPLGGNFPHFTPYQYAGNKPIRFIDLDGLEESDHGKNWDWSGKFFRMFQPAPSVQGVDFGDLDQVNEFEKKREEYSERFDRTYQAALQLKVAVTTPADLILPVNLAHQLITGENLDGTQATPAEIAFEVLMIIPIGKVAKGGKLIVRHGGELWDASNYVRKYLAKANPCGCLVAGTQIWTEDGFVDINKIQKGDLVWSLNEKTNENELKEVLDTYEILRNHVYHVSFADTNFTLQVTADHPFLLNGEWKELGYLSVGDEVTISDHKTLTINKIEFESIEIKVFNLEIDGNHNYFATPNKVLLHNGNPCKFEAIYRLAVSGIQKHHIIPKATYKKFKDELVGLIGRDVGQNIKKIPNRFHGNHPGYSKWIENKIQALVDKGQLNGDNIKKLLKDASDEINNAYDNWRKTNGEENMNDFFKKLNEG